VSGGTTGGGTTGGGTTGGGTTGGGTTGGGTTGGGTTGGATTGGGGGTTGGGTTGGTTGGGTTGGGTTGGGTTGGGTMGGVSDGTFPRTDETVSVAMMGQYKTATYEMGLDDPAYQNGKIYYPTDAKPPFAAVAFSLGFLESRDQLEWWGPVLASHGIVSFHNDPTTIGDIPSQRAEDITAQVKKLMAESGRSGSPLMGKLDLKRIGVMGHSMGGGGTLIAGNMLGDMVAALVPLQPWSSPLTDGPTAITAFPNIKAPTLILGAEKDELASVADHAVPFYTSIKVTKAYAELKGATHMAGTMSASAPLKTLQARLALAWLKIYLESDKRYEDYIYGAKMSETMPMLSVFKNEGH
jgi:triacylglycerol lipase